MAARWQMKMRKFGQIRDDLLNSQDPIIENYLKKVYEKIGGAVESFNSTAPIIQEVNSDEEDQQYYSDQEVVELEEHSEEAHQEDVEIIESVAQEFTQNHEPDQEDVDFIESVDLECAQNHEPDQEDVGFIESVDQENLELSPNHEPDQEDVGFIESVDQENLELSPNHEPDQILRRSKRAKLPLLDNARLERAVYDFHGGFVRIDNGFPEKYDYSKKKTTKRNKTRIPNNCTRVEPINYKKAAKGDYEFDVKSDTNSIQGFVRLRPGCKKPESRTNYAYIFKVKKGQVTINVIEGKKVSRFYLDENSWSLKIDENKHYGIKNCGPTIATLSFIVVKA